MCIDFGYFLIFETINWWSTCGYKKICTFLNNKKVFLMCEKKMAESTFDFFLQFLGAPVRTGALHRTCSKTENWRFCILGYRMETQTGAFCQICRWPNWSTENDCFFFCLCPVTSPTKIGISPWNFLGWCSGNVKTCTETFRDFHRQ